jgi:hypothetical protein
MHEDMSQRTRKEVLERLRKSYGKGSRFERTRVLDEATRLLGYHRKAAIRALRQKAGGKGVGGSKAGPAGGVRGRPKKYLASELLEPLRKIWLTAQQPCGRRLVGALPDWVPAYEEEYRRLSSGVKEVLLSASSATLDRLLRPLRMEHRRGLGGTRPGSLLRQQIPIAGVVWDQKVAGYLEFDTVALCGGRMDGDFVWMLDGTDYATAWVEVRAQWNRGQHGTLAGLKDIERALPFAVRGLDADNGGEFLNYGVVEWCRQHGRPIELTRSRPYRKNDNAHVEQKNWTHVRQWFGYERYDHAELVPLLNTLTCGALGQFQNYFLPTLKLVEKKRTETGRLQRRYGQVETPYARVLASGEVSAGKKRELQAARAQLNPFALEREIQKQLRRIEAERQRKPRVSFALKKRGAKKLLRAGRSFGKQTNIKINQKGHPLR